MPFFFGPHIGSSFFWEFFTCRPRRSNSNSGFSGPVALHLFIPPTSMFLWFLFLERRRPFLTRLLWASSPFPWCVSPWRFLFVRLRRPPWTFFSIHPTAFLWFFSDSFGDNPRFPLRHTCRTVFIWIFFFFFFHFPLIPWQPSLPVNSSVRARVPAPLRSPYFPVPLPLFRRRTFFSGH